MSGLISKYVLDKKIYNDTPISFFGSYKRMQAIRDLVDEIPSEDAVMAEDLFMVVANYCAADGLTYAETNTVMRIVREAVDTLLPDRKEQSDEQN